MDTMTVGELKKALATLPSDYKVFLSTDPEGNSFGTLRPSYLFGVSEEDKTAIIYPIDSSFMFEDIAPKQSDEIDKELGIER